MSDVGMSAKGPEETSAERLARAPRVLEGYAKDIDKYGKPLDSGLPALLRFVAKELPDLTKRVEDMTRALEYAREHNHGEHYDPDNPCLLCAQIGAALASGETKAGETK